MILIKIYFVGIIFRIIVGLVFILSAYLKLQSIDSFEIYVYSFGIFNLSNSFLFSRFIISVEFFLGMLLVLGIYRRKVSSISILLLSIFSFFILYLIFSNDSEHCHCFGEALELSHPLTLLKNMILIGLLAIVYKKQQLDKFKKYSVLIFAILGIFSLAIPLISSPPDSFLITKYSNKVSYDEAALNTFIDSKPKYQSGKHVICFYSASCRFCKMATKKMTVIANKSNHPELITCEFWGKEEKIQAFYEQTNSIKFPYGRVDGPEFLRITNGKMPLILLLDNGVVIEKFGYRTIDDTQILRFME